MALAAIFATSDSNGMKESTPELFKKFIDISVEKNFPNLEFFLLEILNINKNCLTKLATSFKGVSFSTSFLSTISQISPEFYDKVKLNREEEQRWKTDLNKDLGDLGF